MNEMEDLEDKLTGKTLLIYWYLLTKEDATIRELEHELHFSSPSIASHHLNKLLSLGLVEKDEKGRYYLSKFIPIGILRHFVRFRGILLPRYFFLASFFTVVLLLGIIWMFSLEAGVFDRLLFILICSVGAIVCWWETYRLYRLKIL
ncbi:MAG: helix-turn-helix transcriptional regulator [Candidatus Heimdallarchaeota archaeon]|nr:MAG: helix-turn-helix transcriptional regulator [Candidatus Heimdallarchaeota archaeon]